MSDGDPRRGAELLAPIRAHACRAVGAANGETELKP